ncbi:MAG: peptidoglycan bridge formation glycyltransferase FemA/FemB family protein [bacterium]|nr:peptidoglycan bridge formation glycyltransferase FemA/FemB family protein [bacterium]
MPIELDTKKYIFKTKNIWFSDFPFDVKNYSSVTFYACKNKIDAPGFNCEELATIVIDLTQELDVIWNNMSGSSCRYAINKAKRDGVEIKLNQNYEEFYKIYRSFRKNKGLLGGFFERAEEMKNFGTLFVAEVDGEIIGGNLYLEDENNIRWLIGASKRLSVEKEKATLIGNANRLLIWEAIKYAKKKGIKKFDMGGYWTGEDKNDPRYAPCFFKKVFNGTVVADYVYQKKSRLYQLGCKIYQLIQPNKEKRHD